MAPADQPQPGPETQRLDKWLWFARLAKSRTLAAALVEAGKVRVNRVRVTKPAHQVKPGDVLTVAIGTTVLIYEMIGAGARRGPAREAQTLFKDLTPPREHVVWTPAARAPAERAPGAGRPTKRDRRLTDRLRDEE